MKLVEESFGIDHLPYPAERICPPERILFLDIETTGLSSAHNFIYLIGCAYFRNGCWQLIQWFAEQKAEEKDILEAFLTFSNQFHYLIHFNGNTFDLPFLAERARQHGLSCDFSRFDGLDLYKRVFPYRFFLKLPNCKQKTLEAFLGLNRQDIYDGGQLIDVYYHYMKEPNLPGFQILLLHNAEDMAGMLRLTSLLAYADLFQEPLKAKKVQANYYKNQYGTKDRELLITLELPAALPVNVSYMANNCYFKGEAREGVLRVPLLHEELKYFYANYRDYYYLPKEDMAIHKSVAAYVVKSAKEPASAATCYTKKEGLYLPQWNAFVEPFFKRQYKDRELFFELTEELKTNRAFFGQYASYVLQNMTLAR